MGKDRLNELKRKNKNRKSVIIDVPEENGEVNSLKDVFERSNVIKSWIEKIDENNDKIKQILKTKNTINYHKKETQNEIEALFTNNTSISQQCLSKLKTLEADLENVDQNSAEARIKSIQHSTCKTRFHKTLDKSNVLMTEFKDIQKENLRQQLRAKNIEPSDEEMQSLMDGDIDLQIFTENIFAETNEARLQLADIEERHTQLLKIEQMVVEVRDLFLQMSILIDHQSELINRIEYQAQIATDCVHAVDLESARKNKAKSFKLKLIIIAILIVLLVILLASLFK